MRANLARFHSASPSFFRLEARLPSLEYYDGRYWDCLLGTVTRESWQESRAEFLDRLHRVADGIDLADEPLDGDGFCEWLRVVLEEAHPGMKQPELDDHLVDDLGLDSLDMFELAEALRPSVAKLQDDTGLEGLRTVRDWYLAYLTGRQMPAD